MRDKYKGQKSIEQQFAEAKLVPEKDKEHFDPIITPSLIAGGTALIYRYGPEITEAAVKYGTLFLSMMLDSPEISKEDEIDNLDDIKNYKPIIISGKKNIEGEKEGKEEQVTNVESTSASSPSPLPDPNKDDKDKKEMKELKEKWGEGSFDSVEDSIEYHYKTHGEEVGASDLRQYLRKAKEFARNLKRARNLGEVDGATPGVIQYEKNGRYIDLAPNGDIISFGEFKPLKK